MFYSDEERNNLSSGIETDHGTTNKSLVNKIDELINVGSAYVDNTQRVIGMFTTGQVANQTVAEKNCVNTWMVPLDTTDWRFYGFADGVRPLGTGLLQYWVYISTPVQKAPDLSVELRSSVLTDMSDSDGNISGQNYYVISSINSNLLNFSTPTTLDLYPEGIMHSLNSFPEFIENNLIDFIVSPEEFINFAGNFSGWNSDKLYVSYLRTSLLSGLQSSAEAYHPLPNTTLRGFYCNNNSAGTIPWWGISYYLTSVQASMQTTSFSYISLNDTTTVDIESQHLVVNPDDSDLQPAVMTINYALNKNFQGPL